LADDAAVRKGSVESKVLATVNGTPIFDHDVRYWLRKNTQGRVREGTPEQVRNVLETLVTQEVIRQEAEKLGLHKNPQYRTRLRAKQAEIDSLRRTELRRLYYLHHAKQAAQVTGQEAKAYFDAHADQIATRYHVQRIVRRSEKEIREARQRLDDGASFEEVAKGVGLRPDKKWDMGYMGWLNIPEEWREAIEGLEVGGVSGVLSGSGRRFWILRLADKKREPESTFERAQADVITRLREQRVTAERAGLEERLRTQATIVYSLPKPPAQ